MQSRKFYRLFLVVPLLISVQSQAMWRNVGQRATQAGLLSSWYQPASRTFNNVRFNSFFPSAFSSNKQGASFFSPVTPMIAQKSFQSGSVFTNATAGRASWCLALAGIPLFGWFCKTKEEEKKAEDKVENSEAAAKLADNLNNQNLYALLVKSGNGHKLLEKLAENPEAAVKLADRIDNNSLRIIFVESGNSSEFLEKVAENPEAAIKLVNHMNSKSLYILAVESGNGIKFLEKLAENPEAATRLHNLLHGDKIPDSRVTKSLEGSKFLEKVAKNRIPLTFWEGLAHA